MDILYQDTEIIVAVKPYGVLSQSDEKGENSMVERLSEQIGSAVYPVHRLDRTTLGLMVFAKTAAAAKELSSQIAKREMIKTYRAVIHGRITPPAGELTDWLFFDRKKNKVFAVKKQRNGVKKAILHYETAAEYNGFSVLSVTLETGRTHQIRVQFASRGYPLLGDRRYGAQDEYKEIALCAEKLTFYHPKTGEQKVFSITESDLFEEFCGLFGLKK